MQKQFLTSVTRGPVNWEGKAMGSAHAGRGIGHVEFDRVAFHVVTTL